MNKSLRPKLLSIMTTIYLSGFSTCFAAVDGQENNGAMRTAIIKSLETAEQNVNSLHETLNRFESRMNESGMQSETQKVYGILEAELKEINQENAENTIELCKHIIYELAAPQQVNQGNHNTCALAALQSVLYTKHPSLVCSIVLQAAKGKISLENGAEITMPETNILPDREASYYHNGSSYRSYASQLFQIAAANIYWQSQSKDPRGIKVRPGSIIYVQDFCKPFFEGDTGERILIRWPNAVTELIGDETGCPLSNPGFTINAINETYSLLTGVRDKPSLLAHKGRNPDKAAYAFASQRDLKAKLSRLKHAQALPAIISVNLASKTFAPSKSWVVITSTGDKKSLQTKKKDSWHVVCINDYDENTESVQLDNFWGASSDYLDNRSLSLNDLFLSTCPQNN